jgi:hypothetical protein
MATDARMLVVAVRLPVRRSPIGLVAGHECRGVIVRSAPSSTTRTRGVRLASTPGTLVDRYA